jgi:hypothetical protein
MLDLFVKISFVICSWRLSVLISHNWCGPLLWATDANPCFSVIYILLLSTRIITDPCIFISIVYSHLDCSCCNLCCCQWRHNPTVLSPYYCHPIGCFLLLWFRQSSCVLDRIHCDLGCGCCHIHCGCDSLVILSPSSTKFRESLRHSYLWVSFFLRLYPVCQTTSWLGLWFSRTGSHCQRYDRSSLFVLTLQLVFLECQISVAASCWLQFV